MTDDDDSAKKLYFPSPRQATKKWSLTGTTAGRRGPLPNAHMGRHSPTKAGIRIGGSPAAGMIGTGEHLAHQSKKDKWKMGREIFRFFC